MSHASVAQSHAGQVEGDASSGGNKNQPAAPIFPDSRVPRQMMPTVHANYFDPDHEDFRSRNLWSLSNAFTSAFKALGPLKQYEATAKVGLYMSELKTHAKSSESGPLIDCGFGRFRLRTQQEPPPDQSKLKEV